MYSNKKAIESYFYLIIISSIVFTILVLILSGTIFKVDSPNCKDISYDIKTKKKLDVGKYELEIVNLGTSEIKLLLNGVSNPAFNIQGLKSQKITIETDESQIIIAPYLSSFNNEVETCSSKIKKVDTNKLI